MGFSGWRWWVVSAGAALCACAATTTTLRQERTSWQKCVAGCKDDARRMTELDTGTDNEGGADARSEGAWEEKACRSDCDAEFRPRDPESRAEGMEDVETGGADRTEATLDVAPPPAPVTGGNE